MLTLVLVLFSLFGFVSLSLTPSLGHLRRSDSSSRRSSDDYDTAYKTLSISDPVLGFVMYDPSGANQGQYCDDESRISSVWYQVMPPVPGEYGYYCFSTDFPLLGDSLKEVFKDTKYYRFRYNGFFSFSPRNSSDCAAPCPGCFDPPSVIPGVCLNDTNPDGPTIAFELVYMDGIAGADTSPQALQAKKYLLPPSSSEDWVMVEEAGSEPHYFLPVCADSSRLDISTQDLIEIDIPVRGPFVAAVCLPDEGFAVTFVYKEGSPNCKSASDLQHIFAISHESYNQHNPGTGRQCVLKEGTPIPPLEGEPYRFHIQARYFEDDCSDDSFFDYVFAHGVCLPAEGGSYSLRLNQTFAVVDMWLGVDDCGVSGGWEPTLVKLQEGDIQPYDPAIDPHPPCKYQSLFWGRNMYEGMFNVKSLGALDRTKMAVVTPFNCEGDLDHQLELLDWNKVSFILTSPRGCLSSALMSEMDLFGENVSLRGACHKGELRFVNYTESKKCLFRSEFYTHARCYQFGGAYPDLATACVTIRCGGVAEYDDEVCSGRGTCIDTDVCVCRGGYVGDLCESTDSAVAVTIGASLAGVFAFFLLLAVPFVIIFLWVGRKSKKQQHTLLALGDIDLLKAENEVDKSEMAKITVHQDLFEIDPKEITLVEILGSGGSGSTVYLATWKGSQAAFKSFRVRDVVGNDDSFDEFEREVQILSSVNHRNILQFYGACLHPPRVGLLMEFCSEGDFKRFLTKFHTKHARAFPLEDKVRLMREVASAMDYLNGVNIIHRDLKPDNVLVDATFHSKLMDFGTSKIVTVTGSTQQTKRIGTSFYIAPEVLSSGNYGAACDVFSFGIMLHVLVSETFHNPYEDAKLMIPNENGEMELAPQGVYGSFSEYAVMNNPQFRPIPKMPEDSDDGDEVPQWLVDLMVNCWDDEADNRPNFAEIEVLLRTQGRGKSSQDSKRGPIQIGAFVPVETEVDRMAAERVALLRSEIDKVKADIGAYTSRFGEIQ